MSNSSSLTPHEDGVHFVITGGTLDSYYDGALRTVVPRQTSVVQQYMVGVTVDRKLDYTQVCMLDSRMLTEAHRREICEVIENSGARKVIVTHGIFTLLETAKYLESHLRVSDKVIVLTGAAIPLEGVTMSDGGFNIGFAFAHVDLLEPGVYISVAGRVHTPGEVIEYIEEGRFRGMFEGEI